MELVIATRNRGKLEEILDLLKDLDIKVASLVSYPDITDILEDGDSFLGNAQKKARTVSHATRKWCLADDSGLVVDALNGAPGVKSARYAGKQGDHAANNKKLLKEMKDVPEGERKAYFTCTMVLISPAGAEWDIEERCFGVINRELEGKGGFGYDPLFFLPEKGCTMAELDLAEKNEISHRGKALRHVRIILEDLLKRGKI